MAYIGKIDTIQFRGIFKIETDEVIITDEQVNHIKNNHPGDYERCAMYFPSILSEPDYIVEANKPNSVVLLKQTTDGTRYFHMVLRIKTSNDPLNYKNSIITFMEINGRRYNRYLNKKRVLYMREQPC